MTPLSKLLGSIAVTMGLVIGTDFTVGPHSLVVTRADGSVVDRLGIDVVPAGSLAFTGAGIPFATAFLGASALVAGAALITVRRRRVRG